MSTFISAKEDRPTLPSIHTLNLPSLRRNDNYKSSPLKHSHDRHVSTSSTATTSSSRSSSPESPNHNTSPITKFRLIPCPLENANALVITEPIPPPTSSTSTSHGKMGRGVIVMGEKMREIRSGRRPIAKGARVHPYRLALPENRDSSASSRRSSVSSITTPHSTTV